MIVPARGERPTGSRPFPRRRAAGRPQDAPLQLLLDFALFLVNLVGWGFVVWLWGGILWGPGP